MSDDVKIICSQCKQKSPGNVTQCIHCHAPFKPSSSPSIQARPSVSASREEPLGLIRGMLDVVKEWWDDGSLQSRPIRSAPNATSSSRVQGTNPTPQSANAPTTILNENAIRGIIISAPPATPEGQNILRQYRVLKTIELETCNYYEVALIANLQTGMLQPPPTHLIRETAQRPLTLSQEQYQTLSSSQQIPFTLPHQQSYLADGKAYTILPYPGAWGRLAKMKMPQSPEKSLAWTENIARALISINQNRLGGFWSGKEGREAIVIMQGEARLADISFVQPVERQNFTQDVYAIASLLYYLLTGYELTPDVTHAPPQFKSVLRRAAEYSIPTVALFLQELETSKHTPVYQRALRQSVGYLTHQGKVREHNEDYVGVFQLALDQTGAEDPVGLYVVADGMGGQDAGEYASRGSVQEAFIQFINKQALPELQRSTRRLDTATATTPKEQLENLVQVANQLVFNANQATNTNRGTTITAALIIGKQAYIANVGDSRSYLLRDGQLKQITVDHSLVYSLFKAGQITEEEIYSHPRKNEIHRSIGDRAQVQVDTFSETLLPGDKLLLCSDGLWEMVRNSPIQQVLGSVATPQAICDQLIRVANDNGGEDNITAIVVALE